MSGISVISNSLDEAERNKRVYAGGILVWSALQPAAELVSLLAGHVRTHFGDDPEHAHQRLDEQALTYALLASRQAVEADEVCRTQMRRVFESAGMRLDDNYGDKLKLRAQIPHSTQGLRGVAPLTAHRDTWGTNIMAQTNWWAPIYPTTSERTIALYPAWFGRIVPNDSAGWDFAEMLRRYKDEGGQTTYPLLPTAVEPPGWHDALPVSIEPGGLLTFSGAQLHGSVPNETDRIRFSFETRTVNAADARAGRGAPNVDGQAARTTWQLFRGLADDRKLGAMT